MEMNILNIKYLTVKNADHLENIISSVMFFSKFDFYNQKPFCYLGELFGLMFVI